MEGMMFKKVLLGLAVALLACLLYLSSSNSKNILSAENTSAVTEAAVVNYALSRTASASTAQSGHEAKYAIDNNTTTRWCASSASFPQWLTIDIGVSNSITGTEIMFEASKAYKYKIETSSDNKTWTLKVDKTTNTAAAQTFKNSFTQTGRYIRVTVTGAPKGTWASISEFRILVNAYTVSFNSQGGSSVASQTVASGSKAAIPSDPTKTGYVFGGWYKEAACTNVWNFSSNAVTADITLYAKWNLNVTLSAATTNVCNGGACNLFSTTTGGTAPYTYKWTVSPNNGWSSTLQNPTQFLMEENWPDPVYTFQCVVTDSKGCTGTKTIIINQVACTCPTISVTLSAATTNVCNGGACNLFSIATGGTAPYSYKWTVSPNNGWSSTMQNPTQFLMEENWPDPVYTFQCVVTDSKGCAGTKTIIINQVACP